MMPGDFRLRLPMPLPLAIPHAIIRYARFYDAGALPHPPFFFADEIDAMRRYRRTAMRHVPSLLRRDTRRRA